MVELYHDLFYNINYLNYNTFVFYFKSELDFNLIGIFMNRTKRKTNGFGHALRKARLETNDTLAMMGEGIGVSGAFFSAIETGRAKIPLSIIESVVSYFKKKGYHFDENLYKLAMISNDTVITRGVSEAQKQLIAQIALVKYSPDTLAKIDALLASDEAATNVSIKSLVKDDEKH